MTEQQQSVRKPTGLPDQSSENVIKLHSLDSLVVLALSSKVYLALWTGLPLILTHICHNVYLPILYS